MFTLNLINNELPLLANIKQFELNPVELFNLSKMIMYYSVNKDKVKILSQSSSDCKNGKWQIALIYFIPSHKNKDQAKGKFIICDMEGNELSDSDDDEEESDDSPDDVVEIKLNILNIDANADIKIQHDEVHLNYNQQDDSFTFLNEDYYDKYEGLTDDIISQYFIDY